MTLLIILYLYSLIIFLFYFLIVASLWLVAWSLEPEACLDLYESGVQGLRQLSSWPIRRQLPSQRLMIPSVAAGLLLI